MVEQRSDPIFPYALFNRLRYRLTLGMIICVFAPVFLRQILFGVSFLSPTQYVTAIGSLIAVVLGYIAYRRLHVFPGIVQGGYILTSFTLNFGALALALVLFRFNYSRGQFLASYLLAVTFFTIIHFRIDAHRRRVFGIVPGGASDQITRIENVEWQRLNLHADSVANLDGVVVDLRHDHSDAWDIRITDFVLQGVPVYHVKEAMEQLTGRIEVESLSENTLGSVNPNDVFLKIKTAIDWIFASISIVFLMPVMLIIIVAIKLDSPGPALFRQVRIGFRGKPFVVYKFRTMRHTTAPKEFEARDAAITVQNDPRITRLGRFLRTSRLDEIPQLFNIVKGDMSLIGPRPEASALSKWYEAELPFYHYRHIIKPGVTGWAQINQGHVSNVSDVKEKLHYDFYYVKNFSFWLDILIIIRTAQTMVTGHGAK